MRGSPVKAAEQGIVLLENNGILPLKAGKQRILVVGYNAENDRAYLGSYCGTPKAFCKVTEAVKKENPDTDYVQGYSYNLKENEQLQQQALEKGEEYDLILFCSGLDCSFEGEQAGELLQGGGGMLGEQGDRQTLGLPDVQLELFRKLCTLNKKMIVLNFSGGCIDLRDGKAHADAVLQCWYPGALGGKAVSNLLFGAVSPSGKLPVTFYHDEKDLPDFGDYSMANRTYRYFTGEVQYPFGYGLTYTDFSLTDCCLSENELRCTVKNNGSFDCFETLQLTMTCPGTDYKNPVRSLIKISRFSLAAGEEKEIIIRLTDSDFYSVNESGDTVYLHGGYRLYLTDGQRISFFAGEFTNRKESVIIKKCPI